MDKKVLLVIDVQEGFVKLEENKSLPQRIVSLVKESGVFDAVISTRFINKEKSPFRTILNWNGMTTMDDQYLAGTIGSISDYIVEKSSYSAVTQEVMDHLFNECGKVPEIVYIAGMDTDACVLATAIDLFNMGITPIILQDYCASSGGETYHQAGLVILGRTIGRNNVVSIPTKE